ncbi:hypothetical protein WN48_04215 [Eufriesea mexicana]|nr:hypothetical protein WN48_04215 [Eufriesea mexicana]
MEYIMNICSVIVNGEYYDWNQLPRIQMKVGGFLSSSLDSGLRCSTVQSVD